MKHLNNLLSRRATLAMGASSMAFALSGCGSQKENVLSVGGGVNIAMPLLLGMSKGEFVSRGVTIDHRPLQTGKLVFDAVSSGQVDVGIVTDATMALLGFTGLGEVRIFASMMTKLDDAIIARRESGIEGPQDLRGKTIAFTPATSAEAYLNLFLTQNGLGPNDLTLTPMTPPAMRVALQHGNVDAISVWQPFRYNIAQTLGDGAIQFLNDGLYRANILLCARRETIETRAEELKKLTAGLDAASAYARANEAEVIEILSPLVSIETDALTAAWDEYQFASVDLSEMPEALTRVATAITATQPDLEGKTAPDYTDAVDLTLLPQ